MPDDLYLGQLVDASGEVTPEHLRYEADDLTTHGVIVGMTGSGKTGLAVVMLEELLSSGVPALILDPKGDMANLLLNFPDADPASFEPWVNEGDARSRGVSTAEFAQEQATLWQKGLEGAGVTPDRMRGLRDGVSWTVYTPGSTAGTALNVIGDLAAPPAGSDVEALREQASTYVSALLGLVDIKADPLSSREHILLANIIEHAWGTGGSLDLSDLIRLVLEPPFRKLGVFDLDTFFPADDRRALAMRLNALVASPAFAAWTEGATLDLDALFGRANGTKAAIVYLAHLSEAERQFVVSTILSRVVTWMRAQPGTNNLRALVYMDEVFGFLPPTGEPPSKRPILTILKQARAYGVGMVLSTQNPVDLDYKAMSNTGTWMVGRLQTERDKARVLEALASASGGVDVSEVDKRLSSLGKRQFLLHNTHARGGPQIFTTRWAMSYLRGPVTREQIKQLPNRSAPPTPPVASTAAAPSAAATVAQEATPATAAPGADETNVMPEVASGVPVYVVDPAAPWAADLGVTGPSTRYEPALVVRVGLRFDERKMDVDHRQTWEAVFWPLGKTVDVSSARVVDYDARDLRSGAPSGAAVYRLPDAPLGNATFFREFERDLKAHLLSEQELTLLQNKTLRLYSRPGETREEFEKRCVEVAEEKADEEAAKLRDKFDTKMDRVREAIRRAEDRVEQLQVDTKGRRSTEVVSTVGSLLSVFLGGKASAKQIAGRLGRTAGSTASRRGVTRRTEQRLETAKGVAEEKQETLEELESDLQEDLADIVEEWAETARAIDEVEVGLERDDVTIEELAVAWLPIA